MAGRKRRSGKKGIAAIAAAIILLAGGYAGYDEIAELAGFIGPENKESAGTIASEDMIASEDTVASGEMSVTFLDVGQGDCTIIETRGHHVMIDTGNNNQGERVVSYLRENGIDTLDYLIFTHPDADHIGGGDNVLEEIEVERVIMPDLVNDTMTYDEVAEDLERFQVEVIHPRIGDRFEIGDAQFTVLCPEQEFIDREDMNESSVGIKLVHGKNSFIMCGDAEEGSEQRMVERFGKNLECDVLKCGHHGSSTATSEAFLQAADPVWAVISCGEDNSYGHPHQEVLSRLEDEDVQIYRTDKMGTIKALSDGTDITWKCEKQSGE